MKTLRTTEINQKGSREKRQGGVCCREAVRDGGGGVRRGDEGKKVTREGEIN